MLKLSHSNDWPTNWIGDTFPAMKFDLKSGGLKKVDVVLTDMLDGPGHDNRTYCTIEGLQDWEVDMPLEEFVKMVNKACSY